MNVLTTGICLLFWLANWAIYYINNRKYVVPKDGQSRYELSWPTRIFRKVNLAFYVFTLVHLLFQPALLIEGEPSIARLALGIAIGISGILLLYTGSKALGEHYKPCYDGIMPTARVTTGPYRYVKHPLYLANVLLFVALIVLIPGVIAIGVFFCLLWVYYYTIQDENRALDREFPLTSEED